LNRKVKRQRVSGVRNDLEKRPGKTRLTNRAKEKRQWKSEWGWAY
jgi:hypothetical protein